MSSENVSHLYHYWDSGKCIKGSWPELINVECRKSVLYPSSCLAHIVFSWTLITSLYHVDPHPHPHGGLACISNQLHTESLTRNSVSIISYFHDTAIFDHVIEYIISMNLRKNWFSFNKFWVIPLRGCVVWLSWVLGGRGRGSIANAGQQGRRARAGMAMPLGHTVTLLHSVTF